MIYLNSIHLFYNKLVVFFFWLGRYTTPNPLNNFMHHTYKPWGKKSNYH